MILIVFLALFVDVFGCGLYPNNAEQKRVLIIKINSTIRLLIKNKGKLVSQLMTRWLCICQEGPTVDGRNIRREWLMEAAELYDPKVYTAMIWPEHDRWYGSLGHVLEVKTEEDNEGIMSLYARLSPDVSLIHANKNGQLLFCSAEFTPDGDWRGTGKTYLQGLGVTSSPASVGTTRLNFNEKGGNRRGDFKSLVIEEFKEIEREDKKLSGKEKSKGWRTFFNIKEPEKKNFSEGDGGSGEPTSEEKFSQLAEALAAAEDQMAGLSEAIKKIKEAIDTKEFAELRDNLPSILTNFKKMEEVVTKEPGKNPGGNDNEFSFL